MHEASSYRTSFALCESVHEDARQVRRAAQLARAEAEKARLTAGRAIEEARRLRAERASGP